LIDSRQIVANIVLEHSECVEVFQRYRIDFCCRGDLSIEAAARAKGVEVETLVDELARAILERKGTRARDPRELSTPELIAHIVSTHHGLLRKGLPVVLALSTKVGRVHSERNPNLRDLAVAVEELANTLLPHLDEEEKVLFPALLANDLDPVLVTLELVSMVDDHHAVAAVLRQIRAASEDFNVPEWACNSYRTLYSELRQIESDVFTHVHLENHVLRPRFATACPNQF